MEQDLSSISLSNPPNCEDSMSPHENTNIVLTNDNNEREQSQPISLTIDRSDTSQICAICFDSLNQTNNSQKNPEMDIKTLTCSHIFHTECIDEWCNVQYAEYSNINIIQCPLCKQSIARECLPQELNNLAPNTSTILLSLIKLKWFKNIISILITFLCFLCFLSMLDNYSILNKNEKPDPITSENEVQNGYSLDEQANKRMSVGLFAICFVYGNWMSSSKYISRATQLPMPKISNKIEQISMHLLWLQIFDIYGTAIVICLIYFNFIQWERSTFKALICSKLVYSMFNFLIIFEIFQRYKASTIFKGLMVLFSCKREIYNRYVYVDQWRDLRVDQRNRNQVQNENNI